MVKVVWWFVRDVRDQLVVCHSLSDGTLKKTETANTATAYGTAYVPVWLREDGCTGTAVTGMGTDVLLGKGTRRRLFGLAVFTYAL
jgi:hypothetical protein